MHIPAGTLQLRCYKTIKRPFCLIYILLIMGLSTPSLTQELDYHFAQSLPKSIESNIIAHLGPPPTSELARSNFVYTAEQHVQSALNALGFYRSIIEINTDRSITPWQMLLNIQLNTPTLIESININITGDASDDQTFSNLVKDLPFVPGDTIHHGKYEALKTSIQSLGQNRGYFDGHMKKSQIAISQDLQTANITIQYESGTRYRFGKVEFSQQRVDDEILQALIPFSPGDYYQTSTIYTLQNQLQQTGYFSLNLVTPEFNQTNQYQVPIQVTQTPAKQHSVELGAGFATDTNFRFSTGWHMPVVNRKGHSLKTKIEYSSINPKGHITYIVPLTHPLSDTLQLQIKKESDEYGNIESNYLSAKVGRVITDSVWVKNYYLRFLDESWDYANNQFNAHYLLPGFSWSRSTYSGSALDPDKGFSQHYSVESGIESFGSEISLVHLNARWQWINRFHSRHRLVAKAELSTNIIDQKDRSKLPPSLRFFAGGDQSLRGFKYQSLGPRVFLDDGSLTDDAIVVGGQNLAIGSLEYQYYLKPKWRLAFFSDFGNAFDNGSFDLEYSVGSGLHWLSPVGAVRFDVGYSLSQQSPSFRIHINLGTEL